MMFVTPTSGALVYDLSRLDRALGRYLREAEKSGEGKLRNLRKRLEGDMGDGFSGQGKAMLSGLLQFKDKMPPVVEEPTVTAGQMDSLLNDSLRESSDMMADSIQSAAEGAIAVGGESMPGLGVTLSMDNPRATGYLRNYGGGRITKINDTTRERIRRILSEAMEEGWSYDKLAKTLAEQWREFATPKPQAHIRSRAHLIAITEVGEAYEAGRSFVAADLEAAGLGVEKYWLTSNDDRVSDGCRENEFAGWIPNGESFPSGHDRPLRFPGCRCTALYRRSRA